MKFKEWIKQFPKLEESWNSIPEPNKTWFETQIFAYAEEMAKVLSSNAVLAVTSDSKENKKESEVALTYYCQLGRCDQRAVEWQGALCVCEKHK